MFAVGRERERLRLAIKHQLPTFVPLYVRVVEAQMKSEVNLRNKTGVFYSFKFDNKQNGCIVDLFINKQDEFTLFVQQ